MTWDLFSPQVNTLAWSPDSQRLAAGDGNGGVYMWQAQTGTLLRTLGEQRLPVFAVAWSPDGRYLAAAVGRTVLVWEVATGKQVYQFAGHAGGVLTVAWSPKGQYIASGGMDQTVQIWQPE